LTYHSDFYDVSHAKWGEVFKYVAIEIGVFKILPRHYWRLT